MTTYIFKVKSKYNKHLWREVEVLGSQALDDLHMAIQEAFNFDGDLTHLYSFFISGKAWDRDFPGVLPSRGRWASNNKSKNRIAEP